MNKLHLLSFPVNNWGHLYSLQQAISNNDQLTGNSLNITGVMTNQDFLLKQPTKVAIEFLQVDKTPDYPLTDSNQYVLGFITLKDNVLETHIKIDKSVFSELRKNLMEYADIEGIHIMVSLGLLCDDQHFIEGDSLQVIQLDYAMKGDS